MTQNATQVKNSRSFAEQSVFGSSFPSSIKFDGTSIPTISECQPKSFNQSNCLQVPSKLCTGHNIECWYHRRSKPETKYCHKMINLSVSSCSLNQSDDKQVKDEFHQPLPKCDGNDNSIVPEWKFIFSQ